MFAGPQVQPWFCTTDANGLGPATDGACNAPTKYEFFYRSTDPTKTGFQSYDPNHPPSDVATTVTDQGRIVPYIVRRETGTLDRAIYAIAVVFDPGQGKRIQAQCERPRDRRRDVAAGDQGTDRDPHDGEEREHDNPGEHPARIRKA